MAKLILKIINDAIYFIGLSCVIGILGLLLLIFGAYISSRRKHKDHNSVEEYDDSMIDEDIMNEKD